MQTKIEKANDRSAQHVIQSRVTTSARQEDAFIDRRPQQSAQRKLQEIALNGALVHQQKAQVDTLQNDPQGVSQRLESAPQANRTGLPTQLKSAVESLSGMSMDNVRVHYNSTQPAQLNALAYAQGTDIHLAPGQERHLPHEAWHVVQQAQGRVRPTIQAKRGVAVNDDVHLEREADAMGARALQMHDAANPQQSAPGFVSTASASGEAPVQRELDEEDVDRLSKYLVQILPAADSRPQEESIQQALFDWLAEHLKSIHDISPDLVRHHYQRIEFAQGVEANFNEAGPSKQIVQINNDYGGLRDHINGLLAGTIPGTPSFRRDVYQEEINKINADYIRGYKKLAEWVGPFKRLGRASFERDPERFNRVVQLFSWLIPLHETTVKGINNLSGIVLSLKSLLTADINLLKDNAVELPANALISNTATQSIGGYHLGTGSEIITAKPGALFSGEKAEGRGLETELNKFSNRRFIAGHLVAGSLGGKFSDPNLTPLSETFNTEKTGMADPENEGRRRLANNEVIHYATHVTYGNAQRQDWSAVLPTSLTVTISTLRVHDPENDDESELKNYTIPSKTQTYPRNNLPPL